MNKQWYSVLDLVGLPGVPATARGMRIKAERENWETRNKGEGKGFEYHISSLPRTTIVELTKDAVLEPQGEHAALELISELNQEERMLKHRIHTLSAQAMGVLNTCPEKDKTLAFARLTIVEYREAFLRAFDNQVTHGHKMFVQAFKAKELPLDTSVYETVKSISRATVDRWESSLQEGGILTLVRKPNVRRGDSVIANQSELEKFCIALLIERPHFKNQPYKMREYASVQSEKLGAGWKIPGASSFRRWIMQWVTSNQGKYTFSTNHKGFYGKERGLIQEHEPWVNQPNDLWEMDSTPTDIMLNVDGKLVRFSIVACIDVFTRRVKMLLAPTSTATAVSLCLRKSILSWGLPNEDGQIKTDNGSDYVAKKTVSIIRGLGVKHVKATPFSGWEKPFIERFLAPSKAGLWK
ncbi:transposase [Enterovibrio sp. Hal110]